jgi:hypothetical protein
MYSRPIVVSSFSLATPVTSTCRPISTCMDGYTLYRSAPSTNLSPPTR